MRALLAPGLGFAFGTCLFATLLWFLPAERTAWLLPVAAAGSLAVAVVRRRAGRVDGVPAGRRGVLLTSGQLIVVGLAVVGPTTWTLAAHGTVGPLAFRIADVDGLVLQTDGMVHESLSAAIAAAPRGDDDLTLQFWGSDAAGTGWPLESSPLAANLDVLLGLGASDTQSAFLLALLLVAALGAVAAVRYALGRRSWAAVVAGILFGGTLFLELVFDGSAPVVCAAAVLTSLVVVGSEAARRSAAADLVLLAGLLGALAAMLPLFLVPAAVAALSVLVAAARRAWRGRRLGWSQVRAAAARLAGLAVLTIAFDPVGIWRAAAELVHQDGLTATLPTYDLDAATVPGWLLQGRGLYDLGTSHSSLGAVLLLAVGVPVVATALAAAGAAGAGGRGRDLVRVAVPLVAGSLALGLYGALALHSAGLRCTYCLERGLDPAAAVLPILIGVGIGVLAAARPRPARVAAAAAGAVLLAGVGWATWREWQLFDGGSYFLPGSVRTAVSRLPAAGCTVLEAFGQAAPVPPAEEVLVYAVADERAPGRVAVEADDDPTHGLEYFAVAPPAAPANRWFCGGWTDVLTRAASVDSGRPVLFRAGDVALEGRGGSTAVVVDAGLALPQADASGAPDAYLAPAPSPGAPRSLRLVVSGAPAGPVYVGIRLGFATPAAAEAAAPAVVGTPASGVDRVGRVGADLDVCLASRRGPAVRALSLQLSGRSAVLLLATAASPSACPSLPPGGR